MNAGASVFNVSGMYAVLALGVALLCVLFCTSRDFREGVRGFLLVIGFGALMALAFGALIYLSLFGGETLWVMQK